MQSSLLSPGSSMGILAEMLKSFNLHFGLYRKALSQPRSPVGVKSLGLMWLSRAGPVVRGVAEQWHLWEPGIRSRFSWFQEHLSPLLVIRGILLIFRVKFISVPRSSYALQS